MRNRLKAQSALGVEVDQEFRQLWLNRKEEKSQRQENQVHQILKLEQVQ